MAKAELVAGLDLGSSQIVCVLGKRDQYGALEIISGSRVECNGLKGGVVVDLENTRLAIVRAVEEVEDQAKEEISVLNVAIRGKHIGGENHNGGLAISRTDKEITEEDLQAVIENAKQVQLSTDREIIHVIVQDYMIDRQEGVANPIGMEGGHLTANVYVVTAASTHLNNISKSIAKAGFELDDTLLGIFAAGEVIVTPGERDLGVLLIDIGGDTTELAVYRKGSIRYTKEIELGAENITRDLAQFLRASPSIARQIKEEYGVASVLTLNEENKDETINYLSVDGKNERQTTRGRLVEIIQPRIEMMFSYIKETVYSSGINQIIPSGAILVGGGASMSGISEAAKEILDMEIRIGLPLDVSGNVSIINNQTFTTAIGLLKCTFRGVPGKVTRTVNKPTVSKKVFSWFRKMF